MDKVFQDFCTTEVFGEPVSFGECDGCDCLRPCMDHIYGAAYGAALVCCYTQRYLPELDVHCVKSFQLSLVF